jgi:hypothetical protein
MVKIWYVKYRFSSTLILQPDLWPMKHTQKKKIMVTGYDIPPLNRILLEKLAITQLVKTFSTFKENVPTRVCH